MCIRDRDTTDIQRYPDNYEVLSTDAALRAEKIACRLRHLIYSSTTIHKGDYLTSAGIVHGIEAVSYTHLDVYKRQVLDISSLTGDLLTVGMFVALDFVWDRAKADRTEEKAIFIDECWQLLSGAGAAGVRLAGDFLLEIAKTIRGYGGASIFASQDLADFFDLDGGRFGKGPVSYTHLKW